MRRYHIHPKEHLLHCECTQGRIEDISCYSCHEQLVLTPFTREIVSTRMPMSAQQPSQALTIDFKSGHSWVGTRAFVFYPSPVVFAFVVKYSPPPPPLPPPSTPPPRRSPTITTHRSRENSCLAEERLWGGRSEQALMDNIGVTNDSDASLEICAYLGGALERYFVHWGARGRRPLRPKMEVEMKTGEECRIKRGSKRCRRPIG